MSSAVPQARDIDTHTGQKGGGRRSKALRPPPMFHSLAVPGTRTGR